MASPTEITQPKLSTYENAKYFYTTEDRGVIFMAPVNGATTSNSGYPRSELREMRSNGSTEASWNSGSGTHTMECDLAFTHLPGGKPHVVAMQIHGANDDITVLRLEGSTLYVTKGDTTHHASLGAYTLGTRMTVKVVANSGGIKWYKNGTLKASVGGTYSGCYFKTGCYTQANTSSGSGYGEVKIWRVTVTHT